MNRLSSDVPPAAIDPRPSALYRYGWSLSIVVVATLVRIPLEPYLAPSGFLLTLAAVFAAAWVGGFWASLPTQTFVLLVEHLIFAPADYEWELSVRQLVNFGSFYLVGSTVALLSDAMHAAQRRARAQRNEAVSQRKRLQATLACMGDGVIATDMQARVTLLNPAAETMIGRLEHAALGLRLEEVFIVHAADGARAARCVVEDVLRTGTACRQAELVLLTRDGGQQLPIAFNAAPIENETGAITGAVLVFRDESQRQRTEQALREADRRKDEFLATLAHELRNPLAPISTALEVMKLSAHDPHATEELRSMMERQTRHMVRLIDDLLDVSRITRGRLELRRREVDLGEIIRNAVEASQPMIAESRHELQVVAPQESLRLFVDPNRVTQVLTNLLSNAAKFTPPGGRIELEARRDGDAAVVIVADNGLGIPANELENIFQMFTQVGQREGGDQAGLGIGLTLVKQIIEMHGGQVEVESAGENQGSRFRVRIPIGSPPPAVGGGADPATPAPVAARRRVLVVDDNEDALRTLSKMVTILGNEAREASDGVEAVAAAEDFRPDVVLMDLGMPRLDGLGAARRMRAEPWGQNLLMIATTGWGQDEDRRRTKEAGFDHHLVKPVDALALRALLEVSAPRA